ncbi:hypothetical protein [Serratia fonticola]|nr:hypothetical protein [Serratia fonticola]MDK2373775.1 hypothetical protein [Serratia fonticola]
MATWFLWWVQHTNRHSPGELQALHYNPFGDAIASGFINELSLS